MAHFVSPRAEAELDHIWYYIATESDSIDVANRFIDILTHQFYLLAMAPGMGRSRDDLRSGMRSLSHGRYLILYEIHEEEVTILHVVQGSRDLEAIFGV